MKIICIGRNYVNHAKEMDSLVPSEPIVFLKPDTALLKNNKPFYYPDFSKDIHHELELVIKISKNGKNIQVPFAHKYIDGISVGIDFTARDIQQICKEKGLPWEKAKAFDSSAVVGTFIPYPNKELNFSLKKNGEIIQEGNSKNMIFSIDYIISHVSKYFTLRTGDLIYTGTPEGVGPIAKGDKLEGFIASSKLFTCDIK